uniref:U-box domain-containing protein 62-like n=1 Tax=Erigeron canadensis TaxID=72917 RepID=UPI001CB91B80|nr:U-box domain-containing protein 62-like [Erigeron canadensis]
MASEETNLALSHHHLPGFRTTHRPGSIPGPDQPAAVSTSNKATRELTGFIDHQHSFFRPESTNEFRQSTYYPPGLARQAWNGKDSGSGSGDGSDENDENNNNVSSNTSGHSSEKDGNVNLNHISSFGSTREVAKVGSEPSGNVLNDARPSLSEYHEHNASHYQNALALVDGNGEVHYSQYPHGVEGSGEGLKNREAEKGCGFSRRKDVFYSGESGESLRTILSDPITGVLMDDAMILPCGHSFSSGGMQHVMKMKACYTCSHPVAEGLVASNLSLQLAVSAFRREEEFRIHHASKRRRERLDQDRSNYSDSMFMDTPRGKSFQFPLSEGDRVIIKGNKRTPERFVGCEAVVTTQCLNGWYVVKTLDNAESIKVQYRSLAKVSDHSSSQPTSSKMTPNWL